MTGNGGEAGAGRSRAAILAESFGAITAALLEEDVDLADVLDHLVVASMATLRVDAVAVVLDDQQGRLMPVACSTESSRLLELFQLRMDQGPCVDAIRQDTTVVSVDVEGDRNRWPAFVDAALAVGYRSVCSVPMRFRGKAIGALNLFAAAPTEMLPERQRVAQALADLATLAIFHQRTARRAAVLADQLQRALNSRVVIEQAKGTLAERHRIGTEAAFERLRRYARNHNRRLGELAASVVNREVDLGDA